MRISDGVSVRAPIATKTHAGAAQKPPTSIWDPGALLCRVHDGKVFYGTVVAVDEHVDYITVQASTFRLAGIPIIVPWAGTRKEFLRTWQFTRYGGAA